ncbi:MAG: retropepsin-like aspartic protease [Pirellulales bacterium]
MNGWLRASALSLMLCISGAVRAAVPLEGFLPFVGIGLTDEFDTSEETLTFFTAKPSLAVGGTLLGNGTPHFDLALLDTGANGSLLTQAADTAFDLAGHGFDGTTVIRIGGATGFMDTRVTNPLGIYATGLASPNRTGNTPFTLDPDLMVGQTSVSLLSMPAESKLPNVLGLPFASQYATSIRNDQPQIFQHDGRTVRTPQIEFLPLGSGGQGITRRAPLSLQPGLAFAQPPLYFFNIQNALEGLPLHENPSSHTFLGDATSSRGAMFVSVNVENDGNELNQNEFFFDTGASVTVVSELNATRLGFDVVLDEPEFTIAIIGSGGTKLEVPGFFVDQFTIETVGGPMTATNVPVIVLNVTNPADPGNIVGGILGMNILSGRNLVIDPDPSLGGGNLGPQLYISDPVTTTHNWASAATGANWATSGNWNAAGTPGELWIANVNHVSGGNQTAVVSADSQVWEVNIAGNAPNQMTVRVDSGARLTTFSGVNVASGGRLHLNGGTVDAQFVEIRGGTLSGAGLITTGSGPIPGQVENIGGTVAPGNNGIGSLQIEGRFSNAANGTLQMEIGGLTAGTQHDQLIMEGGVSLAGTLHVSLVNGFDPIAGNDFTLITSTDDLGGGFDTLQLPGGIYWDLHYNPNSLVLSMAGTAISGDFNLDRTVNASDYAVWRDTLGDVASYNLWRAHFGDVFSPGTGSSAAVPEPAAWMLIVSGAAIAAAFRRRRR